MRGWSGQDEGGRHGGRSVSEGGGGWVGSHSLPAHSPSGAVPTILGGR